MENKHRIWLAVLPAMVLPFVASLFYFALFLESPIARAIYAGTKLFTVAWPVIAVYLILQANLPSMDIRSKKHVKAAFSGLLVAVPIVALMAALMRTSLGEVAVSSSDRIFSKAQQFGILNHYWLFAILLSVVHSFIEEYYWRWFVFGQLRRITGIVPAHMLAGITFGSHHVVIGAQFFSFFWGVVIGLAVAAGGIIWSIMYNRQKTIVGAWICHLVVDFYIMSIGYKLLATNG